MSRRPRIPLPRAPSSLSLSRTGILKGKVGLLYSYFVYICFGLIETPVTIPHNPLLSPMFRLK